jgi:O-antigen ligase
MSMATVVSLGLIAALALGLAPGRGAPAWRRPVALGCAAALSVPLVVSFSRGAWLATAMAALAVALPVLLRLPRRTLLGVVCGGVLLAVPAGAVALGSGLVGDRLGSMGEVAAAPDQSVVDRYAMWDAALSIWRAEPLTGTGPKGFAAYRDSHASLALSGGSDTDGAGAGFRRQELESPHNMYLLVLAEQGLVGAVALVGAWAALAVCCVARLRAAVRRGGPVDVGLLALGLLVWHAVDFVYADIGGPTTVLTAVAFGVTAWWALSPAAGRERLP